MAQDVYSNDFVTLWAANSPRIYVFIVSLVQRRADADEILQETSRTVWEKFAEYRPGSNFSAWASRIAYLKVLEARRRDRRVPLPFTDVFMTAMEGQIPVEGDEENPRYSFLLECLKKLGDRDRELIGRRYQDGASTAQVAEAMGRTTAWAYKTLSRLHQALFECVERSMRREAGS